MKQAITFRSYIRRWLKKEKKISIGRTTHGHSAEREKGEGISRNAYQRSFEYKYGDKQTCADNVLAIGRACFYPVSIWDNTACDDKTAGDDNTASDGFMLRPVSSRPCEGKPKIWVCKDMQSILFFINLKFGGGDIVILIYGKLNADPYSTILDNNTLWKFYGLDHCDFQDESTTWHVARSAMDWHDDSGMNRLNWLPRV
ncbi:hypothetical protein TNCV_3018131 [Trichonephila clavipes]|nr:hypothetical protein TNCV_3018131 [Trichonephila clavipes]